MSIYVLVVRARSHEYGLHHMYVGGFFTGNREENTASIPH
jgi:hypothetical protein